MQKRKKEDFFEINRDHLYVGAPHPQDPYESQPISLHIWNEKYRYKANADEKSPADSIHRVCAGVYRNDDVFHRDLAIVAMRTGLWIPAGRIQAGAGTAKVVTLMNCYVDRTIEDSMVGIADALKDAMLTQQQGGGIGMDFSTLRPKGAYLQRTGAVASGPLPFMDMWDSMCATIMSAGDRRGAMMATMSVSHPDIIDFIHAKRKAGRLTNFNVSVLVTDAFMQAVMDDDEWSLGFGVPLADGVHQGLVEQEDGNRWYIYKTLPARELWEMITKNTYMYSEPGVIFIDRVNDWNNLKYCETISCTNPCGEQPLPPNGACNLGAVNLARMVLDPFTPHARFNWDALIATAKIGTRFLDNVIDVTNYPLDAQRDVELGNRRIGLGVTGLANAISMLNMKYGSEISLSFTNAVMERLKNTVYTASAMLAAERGTFPLYEAEDWGCTPVVDSLDQSVRDLIREHGIRNGVCMTIAPTGTTSLYCGNVSSGLEPVFDFTMKRKIRRADGDYDTHIVYDYGLLVWNKLQESLGLDPQGMTKPDVFVRTADLTVKDHVRMQSVCQRHVDASISKTINCPEDMSYEEFKLVYWDAYEMMCKGCTTYRPSDVRGSILESVGVPGGDSVSGSGSTSGTHGSNPGSFNVQIPVLTQRPQVLEGRTYKIKWPSAPSAHYVTINNLDGKPFEIFITSTVATHQDWATALSLMISAIFRKGGDVKFVGEELMKIISATDSAFVGGKYWGSLVALVGHTIHAHILNSLDEGDTLALHTNIADDTSTHGSEPLGEIHRVKGAICPKCAAPTLIFKEGCKECLNCGHSTCA